MSSSSVEASSTEHANKDDVDFSSIALQSAGALLAVNLDSWKVHAVSENAYELIGLSAEEILDKPIDKWLNKKQTEIFREICNDDLLAQHMRSRRLNFDLDSKHTRELEYLAQRVGNYLIIELFNPQDTAFDNPENRSRFRDLVFSDAYNSTTTTETCRKIADRIQSSMTVNGVGIYAFDNNGNGHIITLSNDGKYNFPEEGIRAERFTDTARKPLQEAHVRFVSNYEGQSIGYKMSDSANNTVDVSKAFLRAHPVEDEPYLKDFAPAKGFLVLPIVMEKRLWGIILCLNTDDFCPPLVDLRLFSYAAQMISMSVSRAESVRRLDAFRSSQDASARLEFEFENHNKAEDVLVHVLPEILHEYGFEVAKVSFSGQDFQFGIDDKISINVEAFMAEEDNGVTIVDQMSPKEMMVQLSDSVCSEGAFLALSESGDDYVFLGRRDFGLRDIDEESGNLQTPLRPLSQGYQIEALQPLRQSIQLLFRAERERALSAEKFMTDVKNTKMQLEIINASRNTAVSELAGTLAHELNQPLTAVMNFAKACQIELGNADIDIPSDIVGMMDDTIEQAARAGDLLNKLRRFIESGEISRSEEDLHELIKYGFDLALKLTQTENIVVTKNLNASSTKIFADRVQFEQVIFNLVRNAADVLFDVENPEITICTENIEDDYLLTRIIDNGPGVPADIVPKLFNPLTSGRPDGMGLGLSICLKIVEAHGGNIKHRRENEQTVFSFTTPLLNEAQFDE